MALASVAADKRHLVDSKGTPFFALGVNYAGYSDRAWKMWEAGLFDPELIARDFRKAQHSGFNTIRLFVHSALGQDLKKDDFAKLDEALSIAQDHNLKVVLTLNDVHLLNLERVSELDVKVADRYKDVPTVTAYDLENEPVFYNLVAAIYPDGFEAPVQTSQLVDHYGERVSREGALDLQRNRRIPAHLDPDKAYYYINALRLFLEYDQAVNRFVNQGKGTIVEFMLADEAEPWYTLISVLDGTVEAWLRARSEPIRATGCRHMLTVGWNWLHFASLPANRMLDFQQYHNYASLTLAGFNTNVAHLQGLRRAFPDHPLIFGEFGWSNQSSRNPATSQAISAELTALYETAMHAFLRANGFGGAMKWVLNDLDITHNPYEANFGVFKLGDQPKPVRDLVLRISQDWLSVDQAGSFTAVRDIEAGMSYRFDLPHQITVGGHVYQDDEIGWQADRVAHCFITRENEALRVESSGAGQLALEPWKLLPSWDRARETELYRVFSDNQRTRQRTFAVGETVAFDLGPGGQYVISMGVEQPTEPRPPELPEVEPNPGEHVVLLADSDDDLAAALGYIRSFTPDFTFAAETVAGRWAYVTVIATPAQIAAELLENMLGAGAILVERVVGDSPEDTKAILDEMVSRGQRFLSAVTPPQEEPPGPSPTPGEPEPPPPDQDELYVIQPGDTLGKIAQTVYGDFRLWTLIFEANRDKIADPALIRVGWELRIPARA
jgi:hypothetical protein